MNRVTVGAKSQVAHYELFLGTADKTISAAAAAENILFDSNHKFVVSFRRVLGAASAGLNSCKSFRAHSLDNHIQNDRRLLIVSLSVHILAR